MGVSDGEPSAMVQIFCVSLEHSDNTMEVVQNTCPESGHNVGSIFG